MTPPSTDCPWVLIVDDDQDNRELLAEFLEAAGYQAEPCGTVAEAEAALDARSIPCLVVCDVTLPDRNGVDFIAAMRLRPGYGEVPVVYVTGVYAEALRASGEKVLTKPFDLHVLMDMVGQHCGEPSEEKSCAA